MLRFVWLALAGACAALAVGDTPVPFAAWLGPIFMLRFVRSARPVAGLGLGALAAMAGHNLAWRDAIIFQGLAYHAIACLLGLVLFLPVVADRLLAPRLPAWAATLVFPSAVALTEYAWSSAGLGSWGVAADSQWNDLPLLQVLSVAGPWGVGFLQGGLAALVNLVWERDWQGPDVRRAAAIAAGALAAVLLLGGLRLAFDPPHGATVRVAGVTADNLAAFRGTWGPVSHGRALTPAAADLARPATRALQEALLDRSRREARAGAKIVVWSEGAALVLKDQEAAFIAEGRRLAAQEHVYLFMGMATLTPGAPRAENKVVAIDPTGAVRGAYLKSRPTPGEASVRGDGRIPVLDTPYGRLAWAICYDFDFQALIRQAGRAGADILLDPSWDSRGMDPMHSHMAALRAIENGAALLRVTEGGLSLAVDSQGQVLAAMDDYASSAPTKAIIADLPVHGSRTLYPRLGDWLPWTALALLAGTAALALRPARTAAKPARGPVASALDSI